MSGGIAMTVGCRTEVTRAFCLIRGRLIVSRVGSRYRFACFEFDFQGVQTFLPASTSLEARRNDSRRDCRRECRRGPKVDGNVEGDVGGNVEGVLM